MKKFMVIGLGNFGSEVTRKLFEKGNEVIGIDRDKEKVEKVVDCSTRAIIADAEDKNLLASLGVAEMDAVVLSIGGNVSQSIITTLFLKELKVKNIFAKANDESHGRVLVKLGADRVIFPEKEVAHKLANQLTNPSMIDYLDLVDDYILTEMLAPVAFSGKSLADLNLRRDYDLLVVGVREAVPEKFTLLPAADFVIKDSDVLVIIGKAKDIHRLEQK
ncbi:MAG: TrkA family potassium uptake protein [Candidatus Glassbacteria bacterium]